MFISVSFCFTKPYTINDRGMVQLIRQDSVILRQKNFKQPSIGIKARYVQYGIFFTMKLGQFLLQLLMYILQCNMTLDKSA